MKNVAAALVKAQRAFGPALKSSTNPHFRSKYADLSACIEAVIDALNGNGIAMMQQTRECESGVTVETVLIHESGETISSGPLHVPAQKQDPQGYGSALTYARRYSLMAACGIAPEDDDGNAARVTPRDSLVPVLEASIKAAKEARSGKPMDGAGDSLSEERKAELEDFVLYLLELRSEGRSMEAYHAYYELPENDDKLYVWKLLAKESKFRAEIKANSPHRKEAVKNETQNATAA